MVNVLSALKNDIVINSVYCWTDSQTSLAWIRSINKEFKTFVQNRVLSIRKNVDYSNWRYCKTKENPADIITGQTKTSTKIYGRMEIHFTVTQPLFMRIPPSKKRLKQKERQTRVLTLYWKIIQLLKLLTLTNSMVR